MSQLKVLIYGNHPNLALYAWRFQFAKSVDLYHVSDSKSNEFSIETQSYGTDTFRLQKHFNGFNELKLSLETDSEKFDLVILSASSLQEISSITTQLNSVIMNNTKIFVESSGFVQLEPFIRMSVSSPQVKVFSLISDYDIRAVASNRYVQFNGGNKSKKQTIFIGETGSLKTQSASNSYPKQISSLLTTFHSLFLKLFPDDAIDTCNFSPLDFLTQQWKLAIPRVCFDPLLVLFEEFVPKRLHQQILAKPLISGLVTEIITLTRTMGARLPSGYDTESDLLERWVADNGENNYPSLLYHFEHRSAPLDIDLLLLQPILLADDFTIKTPYLEFLYSMMCQFKKLNNDESKLFTRSDKVSKLRDELGQLSLLKGTLKDKETEFNLKLNESKEAYQNEINSRDSQISMLGDQLQREQSQNSSLRHELIAIQSELSTLRQLQSQNQSQTQSQSQPLSEPRTPVEPTSQVPEQQYTETGTPVLRDIEDMAVYAIPYAESPVQDSLGINGENPASTNAAVAGASAAASAATPPSSAPLSADEHALRERELKLRRRELELQERELQLQKKQSKTMLNQKYAHAQSKNGMSPNENPSQYSNQMQNRKLHGQSYMGKPPQGIPGQYMAPHVQQQPLQQVPQQHRQHSSVGLPGMPGVGGYSGSVVGINGGGQRPMNGFGISQNMLDGAAPMGSNGFGPKTFQKTSRKNRRSNMPMLRNPSNTMLSDFNMPQAPTGQQRFNSLSGNLPPLSMNYHNGSMPRLNGNPNPMRTGSQGQLSNLPTQPQQQYQPVPNGMRQISTSTMLDEGESTASVIQRPPNAFQQQQQEQQFGSNSNSNPNSNVNLTSTSNSNSFSNSNSHSTSPPPLESDISSTNPPSSSKTNLSPVEPQDKLPSDSNNEQNQKSNELKKSKFSFFHSKKK